MATHTDINIIYEAIVASFLAIWFLLTILCQFRSTKFSNYIRHTIDIFGLIPLWTFFAPNPGKSDYHLLYRDKIDEENNSEWEEMDITEERSLWSWCWNPDKRDKKILSDVIQSLIASIPHYKGANGYDLLMFSMPYLIVLHAVSNCECETGSGHRQFMLAETSGYLKENPPSVILLSVFHQI
ncbi:hypothetical protein HDE69_002292 [Pedobacter cryoconitis]|uniref:Uncharacterized protein n=1 Tax=Pedobacter cryoconitis TaxID=188932 RepID=A0A7W8YSZ7_9SPHI|nr:hypothetical protein [Pedobacter cryoconitis]MBB5621239.1 hypothetical protein [Pedobacter cryoconitis]